MPSVFDITVATNTVTLDNKREGIVPFTVKNNSRRRLRATARVATQPPEGAQWLTILPPEGGSADSASVRDFAVDSTQQFQVKIAVPMDAPPGSYTLKLAVAEEVNPDENFTESPEVVFTVLAITNTPPPALPAWIIPAVIIAILVIVGIIAAVVISGNNEVAPTATPTATATATPTVTLTATATATAIPTATPTAPPPTCPAFGSVRPPSPTPQFTSTLRVGSSGNVVLALQIRLCELNYDPGVLDGRFGRNTQLAVQQFQALNGLTVDGLAGTQTWTRLFSRNAVRR